MWLERPTCRLAPGRPQALREPFCCQRARETRGQGVWAPEGAGPALSLDRGRVGRGGGGSRIPEMTTEQRAAAASVSASVKREPAAHSARPRPGGAAGPRCLPFLRSRSRPGGSRDAGADVIPAQSGLRRRRHGRYCARESRPPRGAPVETRDASAAAAAAGLPAGARAGRGRGGACSRAAPHPHASPGAHARCPKPARALAGPGCVGLRGRWGRARACSETPGRGPAWKARGQACTALAGSTEGVGTQA